ncbi:class IIb bacteriocin, lactobin A/cerein 7B family [Elizabethkingia anophelis]|nr:class IIb bacteriocin, lactobin A/cerein 7B family [Elizabethkingia anophelis]MCT3921691.1 class IIb bacteriocin, lactobin A/cerein 7B family [Elizabethkingia anophelis]
MKLHTNTLVSNLSTVEMINIEGGVMPWKNLAIAAIVGGPLGAAFYLGYYNGSH